MARNINPVPQFLDANGDPFSGGKMFYFESGTSTDLVTYSDEAETIPNTQPVILDSEGRLPNVFFSGTAKQVLFDFNDVQIWERDPVGSTVISGNFADWNTNIVYDIDDIVTGSDGKFYISLQNNNQGNDPTTSAVFWAEIRHIEVYNVNVSYNAGVIVQTTDGSLWKSLVGSNLNNNPLTDDGTNWGTTIGLTVNTPVNVLPADSAIAVSTTPTLTSTAFTGTDVHESTQWQITLSSDPTFAAIVYDSGFVNDLVSHTVPAANELVSETEYIFRVRFNGAKSGYGIFSTATSFTTEVKFAESFQTTLYVGTGVSLSVVSNLDFILRAGLVWIKNREAITSYNLYDTSRGVTQRLQSDQQAAETVSLGGLTAFNNDGFTVNTAAAVNSNGIDMVAWQWIEQVGFFDIVEYTGDGVAGRTVALDLDDGTAVFGMAIVKDLDNVRQWEIQHRSLGGTQHLVFSSAAAVTSIAQWNDTAATNTLLTLGTDSGVNFNGARYVSYNFAHNPAKGIFCGTYTGTGVAGNTVVTGFPVGLLLVKNSTSVRSWTIIDNLRGETNSLSPDTTSGETVFDGWNLLTDGFEISAANPNNLTNNQNGNVYVFMALADPAIF